MLVTRMGRLLAFLSREDAAKIKSISTAHCVPMSPISPFYDWSINEVNDFWLVHVRSPMDETSGRWTSFTFFILDEKSAKDHKCILCCDAPDIGEEGDEVIVKSVRLSFTEAAFNMVSFEMLTVAPSEMNRETYISVMPPAWVDMTGFPPGELTGKIAAPEYAGAKKRWALAGRGRK